MPKDKAANAWKTPERREESVPDSSHGEEEEHSSSFHHFNQNVNIVFSNCKLKADILTRCDAWMSDWPL